MLLDVAKKEGYELDSGSAELLSILGDGSFRDALGMLQKILNFNPSQPSPKEREKTKLVKITREDVEKITGAPKTTLVNDFISAIALKDLEKGILVVKKAAEENLDMKLFLKLIIQKFRMAIILRYAPKLKDEMMGDLSEGDLEFLQSLIKEDPERRPAASYGADKAGMINSHSLAALLEAYENIDKAFIAELPLELALVKILSIEK